MARSKIYVNTNCVADQYATPDVEKIIEFSSPNGGGLIAFRLMDDGWLRVDVYRTDPAVVVSLGASVRSGAPRPLLADALAAVDRAARELDQVRDAREDDDAAESEHLDALVALADAVRASVVTS